MQERGLVVGMQLPLGEWGQSQHAPARRVARSVVRHGPSRRAVSTEQRQLVFALGCGRYRVVTTTTSEQVVDAEGLARLGLSPPSSERRDLPLEAKPESHALRYWAEVVRGSLDNRIRSAMPTWAKEFGLERVQDAMAIVASERTHSSAGGKYHHLVKVLRRFRAGE